MPIKKKKIVEKVVAFEGEQDFIVNANKPEYISAGDILFVEANGLRDTATPSDLIPTNTSGSSVIRQDTIQSPTTVTQQDTTPPASNLPKVCDATIDQFNISVSGNTATISTTIKQGVSPTYNEVRYSLDGGDAVTTTSTFLLTNLSAGSHSISVAAVCSDGGTSGKLTKSFNIPATIEKPSTPRGVDPSLIDQLKPPAIPTPTTTVTSTTTFIPPFGGGGFGGGGGGSTETTETKKKNEFPLLLVLIIAGTLFLLTKKKKKD